MDFLAWEVLSSLSEHRNVFAKYLLDRWDTLFKKEDNSNSLKDKVQPFINEMIQWLGEQGGASPEAAEPASSIKTFSYWTKRDLRIRDLMVSGYRGIPFEDGELYGMSFADEYTVGDVEYYSADDQICSLIVMGNNGSGKTSLYSAIELAVLNNTSIENKHKVIDDVEIKKFRHHQEMTDNPVRIYVKTNDSSVTPRYVESDDAIVKFDVKSHIDLSPFFCSESELAITECSGISMIDHISKAIGLQDTSVAVGILKVVSSQINEEISNLNNLIKAEDRETTDQEAVRLNLLDDMKSQADAVAKELAAKMEYLSSNVLVEAQTIINGLMKDYESEDIKLSYDTTEDGHKIFNGMLLNQKTGEEIDPRHYFNNFRFKLYMVSIQIAIAFYIMKSRKIQFPLIFDDIFDSSDFANRYSSKAYFQSILDQYSSLDISDKPLQLILFTQDEIIAESVYDGILECHNDSHRDYKVSDAKLVQMFPPQDSDKEDIKCMSLKLDTEVIDDENSANKLDEKIYFYKNLYDVVREYHNFP